MATIPFSYTGIFHGKATLPDGSAFVFPLANLPDTVGEFAIFHSRVEDIELDQILEGSVVYEFEGLFPASLGDERVHVFSAIQDGKVIRTVQGNPQLTNGLYKCEIYTVTNGQIRQIGAVEVRPKNGIARITKSYVSRVKLEDFTLEDLTL